MFLVTPGNHQDLPLMERNHKTDKIYVNSFEALGNSTGYWSWGESKQKQTWRQYWYPAWNGTRSWNPKSGGISELRSQILEFGLAMVEQGPEAEEVVQGRAPEVTMGLTLNSCTELNCACTRAFLRPCRECLQQGWELSSDTKDPVGLVDIGILI